MLRPVLTGLLQFESLKNGEVDLEDVAMLNEALDVKAENERRLAKHYQR